MLLKITYTAGEGENALALGYLLFKNPARPQMFPLNTGNAYVFYPEATQARCTAALLLDINPIDLARGKQGSAGGGLFDYVNDRPYAASSFLSTALSKVFGTALSGRCDKYPQLAKTPLALTAEITSLPCRGEESLLHQLFAPLGYTVLFESSPLDEAFPAWQEDNGIKYGKLTLSGTVCLQSLLKHLYVLIPVLDSRKHYWFGEDEVEKLLRFGDDWLKDHPEKELIARRYMGRKRSLARLAMQSLFERLEEEPTPESEEGEALAEKPEKANLNTQRLAAVAAAVRASGARTVIDLGCGEGRLLTLLLKEPYTRIAGADVSWQALERAGERLHLSRMQAAQSNRLQLFQSSLTYRDERFAGYDAACVVEVIEHLDESRLAAFAQVLFGEAKPETVVLTTPNIEYNKNYATLNAGALRHNDHRFEWTRAQFSAWVQATAEGYGFSAQTSQVGEAHPDFGAPTQMAVFTKIKTENKEEAVCE